MSENTEAANDYLRQLAEQREAYQDFARERVWPLFGEDDHLERRPPRFFVDSSYLYVRSFDGDNGRRPFANQVFWLSPDIRIRPTAGGAAYTRTLQAGDTYEIRCRVHNRGDMTAPSAKVEFWLGDPTLGFSTRFARHLTLGQVPSAWINAQSSAEVLFTYTVPPAESGHRCLFARVFSFSPPDLPLDDDALDPTIDRRVAQQNLEIVQQGQPFLFNWIHNPNAEHAIEFVPMTPWEIFALRHPLLADVTPFEDFPHGEWAHFTQLELVDLEAGDATISPENNRLFVTARDPDGVDLQRYQETRAQVQEALVLAADEQVKLAEFRGLFADFRQINSQAQRGAFKMEVPHFGLSAEQVIGVHVRAVDRNGQDGNEVIGGITLLIVGD